MLLIIDASPSDDCYGHRPEHSRSCGRTRSAGPGPSRRRSRTNRPTPLTAPSTTSASTREGGRLGQSPARDDQSRSRRGRRPRRPAPRSPTAARTTPRSDATTRQGGCRRERRPRRRRPAARIDRGRPGQRASATRVGASWIWTPSKTGSRKCSRPSRNGVLTRPPTTDRPARTMRGRVITRGDSCGWASSSQRGSP